MFSYNHAVFLFEKGNNCGLEYLWYDFVTNLPMVSKLSIKRANNAQHKTRT